MPLQKIEFMYDIPEGYKFVRYGFPKDGEKYLCNNRVRIASWDHDSEEWPIVEKIPEQELPSHNTKRRKHADLIHAWAEGAIIQFEDSEWDWLDCENNNPDWDEGKEYRIKPKARIIRFRNWLSTDGYVYASQQKDIYKEKYFKEWLGDWQEVEIEEND